MEIDRKSPSHPAGAFSFPKRNILKLFEMNTLAGRPLENGQLAPKVQT
jgi:hypothetical protein